MAKTASELSPNTFHICAPGAYVAEKAQTYPDVGVYPEAPHAL